MAGVVVMRIVLIAVGIVIILVSLLADVAGYGDGLAFGRLQLAGTFGGIILLLLVPWFRFHQRRRAEKLAMAAGAGGEKRGPDDRRHTV